MTRTLTGDRLDWHQAAVGTVEWYDKCTEPGSLPEAECGHIIVPLNYFNASAGTAKIALSRYKATKGPSKGSVFVNPGGPGIPGTPLAYRIGPRIQRIATGEDYDIVGFDPRGIGKTEPTVNCFGTAENRKDFIQNTVLERGYQVAPESSLIDTREHLIQQMGEADALYRTQMALCAQRMGDVLGYLGTSSVARDIDFMTRVLDGDEALIKYWGGSYGSILGQYLVNMFPDRVGRVVIDGIASVELWTSVPPYKEHRQWLSSAGDTYQLFLSGCSEAGPSQCPLAEYTNEDPRVIQGRLENWMESLFDKPLAVTNSTRPGILSEGQARSFIFETLEQPMSWVPRSRDIFEAMNGDGSAILNTPSYGINGVGDLWRSGVSCNDQVKFPKPDPHDVVDEALYVMKHVSRFVMSIFTIEPDSGCEYWPVTPSERYAGPWNKTLRNPILIHSNTADPITPIVSGKRINELLGDSARLAIQDGPGHCSLTLPSACTVNITRAYFNDGTLPPEGHICQVDAKPFDIGKDYQSYSAAQLELLEDVKYLSDFLTSLRAGRL
ncbi:alpha/beta-hydrolase [Dentipellis sp. KUC8613]|nr:alpha/beta-hydrolase [Dentipellis sp. KUC8613]